MQTAPEAFLLLSLPNCTLTTTGFSESGLLGLQCVTILHPEASSDADRDVYLVLRISMSEIPIDPSRVVRRSETPYAKIYTFYSTPTDPSELVLTIPTTPGDFKTNSTEDIDTFDGILEQYVVELQTSIPQPYVPPADTPPKYETGHKDLRGHLVMINEDNGEIVGEVEDRFRIREDPSMHQRGHENDPVIIEVGDEQGLREDDAGAMEAFARIVPPDQRDWITTSAAVVSHAISFTTNLLITTITTASNYYISKSAPSPHHTASGVTTQSKDGTTSSPNSPPPLPPRALVFLTSERTRKGLRSVHTISGQAVKVSAKTVKTIDSMIRRAMGAKPKQNRLGHTPQAPNSLLPVPHASSTRPCLSPRSSSTNLVQPQYGSGSFPPTQWNPNTDSKPPLPPRRSPSPQSRGKISPAPSFPSAYSAPPLIPSRGKNSPPIAYQNQSPNQPASQTLEPLPHQPKLSTTSRVLISANLILATIDDSSRRILDAGTDNVGRVMGHKYGAEAAESTLLAAGTARNVGLVYIDMSGIGRRALLKRVGKTFIKARVQKNTPSNNEASGSPTGRPVPPVPGTYTPPKHQGN